jgi:hypothetical protein
MLCGLNLHSAWGLEYPVSIRVPVDRPQRRGALGRGCRSGQHLARLPPTQRHAVALGQSSPAHIARAERLLAPLEHVEPVPGRPLGLSSVTRTGAWGRTGTPAAHRSYCERCRAGGHVPRGRRSPRSATGFRPDARCLGVRYGVPPFVWSASLCRFPKSACVPREVRDSARASLILQLKSFDQDLFNLTLLDLHLDAIDA